VQAGTFELNALLEEARCERDASQKELGELRLQVKPSSCALGGGLLATIAMGIDATPTVRTMQVSKELARASWLRGPSASRLRTALLPPASAPLAAEEEKVTESAETPQPSQSLAQPSKSQSLMI